LVGAIIAVETSVRGPFWRYAEWILARILLRIGYKQRVASMSLGPAQLQPRRVGVDLSVEGLGSLMNPLSAQYHCGALALRISQNLGLDANKSPTWGRSDWRQFGKSYNGSFDYGDVLRATFIALISRPALQPALRGS
jgi:hypothetical protein